MSNSRQMYIIIAVAVIGLLLVILSSGGKLGFGIPTEIEKVGPRGASGGGDHSEVAQGRTVEYEAHSEPLLIEDGGKDPMRLFARDRNGEPLGIEVAVYSVPPEVALALQEPGATAINSVKESLVGVILEPGVLEVPVGQIPAGEFLVAEAVGVPASLVPGRMLSPREVEFVFPRFGALEVSCMGMPGSWDGEIHLSSVYALAEWSFAGPSTTIDRLPYGDYFVRVTCLDNSGYAHVVVNSEYQKVELLLSGTVSGELILVDSSNGMHISGGALEFTSGEGAVASRSPHGSFVVSGVSSSASRLWVNAAAPGYATQSFSVPVEELASGTPVELSLDTSRVFAIRCRWRGQAKGGVHGILEFRNSASSVRTRSVRLQGRVSAKSDELGLIQFEIPHDVAIAGVVLLDPVTEASALVDRDAINEARSSTDILEVELALPEALSIRITEIGGGRPTSLDLRIEHYAWWPGDPGKYAKRSANLAIGAESEIHLIPYAPRFGLALYTVQGKKC